MIMGKNQANFSDRNIILQRERYDNIDSIRQKSRSVYAWARDFFINIARQTQSFRA
jgi:hypothetical protein